MTSIPNTQNRIKNMADLQRRLGGIALDRIRFRPFPGTATVRDVIDIQQTEGVLCELVEGVLLDKAVGYNESGLALFLGGLLNAFVIPRNLGLVTGPDGTVELTTNLVRIPDLAYTSWERLPDRRRPQSPVPHLAPDLAVEVLSVSNTPGEMAVKRQDYFTAGVKLVWEVNPRTRTVLVYTSPTQSTTLTATDTLDGGTVLPGFILPLQVIFTEQDRQG